MCLPVLSSHCETGVSQCLGGISILILEQAHLKGLRGQRLLQALSAFDHLVLTMASRARIEGCIAASVA